MNRLIAAVVVVFGSGLSSCTVSQTADWQISDGAADGQVASGVVFDDRNGNGQRDRGEAGLAGVGVSNGSDVVLTDRGGRYAVPVDDDAIIFVIKPAGWMTPVDAHNSPRFFYSHKPNGSPALRYPGVDPTGPLPASVDFALRRQKEPKGFKAILFGDPQPATIEEVRFLAHDIVEELVGFDASFGVSLGDLVFDDLDLFEPLNEVIGHVGMPWYSVLGNHDINYDAATDALSDETYERVYGPPCYAFNWGRVHFVVLDDVHWNSAKETGKEKGGYHGEIGAKQMAFVQNDLKTVPHDRLVVVMMHIPLNEVRDRAQLLALLHDRPHTFSMAAHTHTQSHRFIGDAGSLGDHGHHHFVNATTSGSWWKGLLDEQGIPHTTMRDGAPNGYSILTFDGSEYSIRFKAARRPQDHQMTIYAPDEVMSAQAGSTEIIVNVFAGSSQSTVEMRLGTEGKWISMQRVEREDPYYADMKAREETLQNVPRKLPKIRTSDHIWTATLPANAPTGSHTIEVRTTDMFGQTFKGHRIIAIR